jgi:PAS domain S-box-containing protein
MDDSVNILLLEDNKNDAELIYWKIKNSKLDFKWTHVSDLIEFVEILDILKPDIVLSDYNLVGFTGIDALEIVKQKCPLLPFVIVTGNLDEETAAESIKSGAWDYVLKDRLSRLDFAIKNALDLKKEKEIKNKALENLKKSEERFALAIEGTKYGIWDFNLETGESYFSSQYKSMLGYSEDEINLDNSEYIEFIHPQDRESAIDLYNKHLKGEISQFQAEIRIRCKDGTYKWILCRGKALFDSNGNPTRVSGLYRDISESKAKEIEILKLSKAVRNAPVSIVITDLKGIIEYVNPKFSEISGFYIDEVIGKPTSILKSGRHDNDFYKDLWDKITNGKEWNGELLNKKKNGELFWESAFISGIKDSENKVIGFMAIKEDITQKKKFEIELVKAKEKAEQNDRLKTAFLHNLSHEIRTPMNAIIGFTELLKKNNLQQEQKDKYVNIIVDSGNRLLHIMNNLIDISLIDSNQMTLNSEIVDINVFVDQLLVDFNASKLKLIKPQVELKSSFPQEINICKIKTDPIKFRQIWDNLISNSLKYTDKGFVEIGCIIRLTSKNKEIEFYVKDTGIGISESDKDFIFDRFRQADNDVFKDGLGLGLSLTKSLIELLDGKMKFISTEGTGSTFYFTFPLI